MKSKKVTFLHGQGEQLAARLELPEEEQSKAPAIADLIDYFKRHAKRFKKSWGDDQRILENDVR